MRPGTSALALLAVISLTAATALAEPAATAKVGSGWQAYPFEIGAHLTHLTLEDIDSGQTLPMGGLSASLRYRLTRRLGLEASVALLLSDELGEEAPGEVIRVSAPATVSALWYLFPDSRIQVYLLGGIGVASHRIEYQALGQDVSYTTPVGQLGIGVQYRLDDLRFDLSFRSLVMHQRGEDHRVNELPPGTFEARPVGYEPWDADRTVTGGMITLGVHFGL